MDFVNESGTWYGIVANYSNNKLILIDFGNSLDTDVSNIDEFEITTPAGVTFNQPSDVEITKIGTDYIVFVGNRSGSVINRLVFSGSITNDPTGDNITVTGSSQPRSTSIARECDNWYLFVASEANDKIHKLDFGTDITSSPIISEMTLTGDTFDHPFRIEIKNDAANFYGFVSGPNNLLKLDFGVSLSTSSISVSDLGNLGVMQSSLAGFDFEKDSSDYRGFAISSNNKALYKISFPDNCNASIPVSTENEPLNLYYDTSGDYEIALKALDANGNVSYSTNTVTVNTNVAPDIDFIIDDNRCVSNANSFTSINTSGDIQTYSWDFGDGSGTSSSADTTYLYDSVNTFTVTLDVVSTGGCFNSVSQEISIYPEPSTPDFDYTAASLCSNSEITFINKTDSTGLEGVISYLWDFDGEATSTQKDTVYVFSSTGTKTVGLQGMIPGCTTVVYSEDLVIEEGPTALFSYSNNCFGSAIEFTDESSGLGIVSYSWDFGDGLGTSSQSDTVYQYSGAGTYSVRLTVTNSSGCETTYTEDITVNDQPLTDFTSIGSTENVPVQFNGLDLTLSDDSITGWLWDFDGLGSSTDQNPSFTFTEALSYTVSLMVSTSQGCADSVGQIINITESVCPYSDFTISNPTVCTNEVLSLTNSSANGTTYEWDFCVGELSSIPTGEETITVSSSSTPTGISYIEDDSLWYGFVLSRGGNTIQRISYGSNLDSAVSTSNVTDLGNIGGLLSGPEGISFVQESGIWYGIVANYTTDQLVLLNFGASLSTDALDITGSEIPTPSGVNFNLPSDIEITKVGTDYVMFVGNRNGSNINRLIFSGSITNDPTGDDITVTGSSKPRSTSLLRDCDNWYLFVASEDNDKLHKLSFGNDITSAPTVTELTLTGDVLDQPFRIEIVYDALSYYGFLSGNSNLYRLNIGNDISTGSVSVTDLGDLGVLQSSLAGFDFVKHESDYRGFAISSNTETVYKISFSDNCSASQLVSSEEQPSTISYSESGTYEIALKALDANGNVSYSTNTITVNTNVAPDIDFIIDDNRCVSNANSFTSINTSGDIQTYSWDFGDGSGTSSSADTTYLYDSVNTFTVTLDVVSTGGCFNSVSQEISIYPEPSTPDFDYTAASLCSNSEITFINKTDSTGLEGVISYLWDFDGEATSTQKDTVYVFSSTGTKTVGLQGMIPGCTTVVYSEDLVIEEGPTALFSYSNNCFGSAIEFTDESSGLGIVSYSWDFGDGLGTSSQSDTVYQYSGAGTYSVRLTVTNSSGCETTYTEDITVNDQPLTDFTSIGSTENVPVQFNGLDLTLSDDSITGWLWDFDGLGSSTDQNPSFTFTEALSYTVSLMVSTSQGCADSVGQIINITESVCPYSDFTISNPTVCTNEVLSLTNSSANGTTYEWDFCVGELSSIPTGEETITVSSSSTPTGISYIEDDSLWYGFVLSRGGNTIQRISYGSNLDSAVSTANVTDLGNIGGLLSGPEGISFVQESGIWYGIVANYTTDQLVLLNFGASLSTDALDITGSEIPTPSGVNFNLPSDIEITKVGTDYVMFVGNRNGSNINRLIFSGSITNDPTGDDITVTGSSKPRSTSLLRDCDNWYLFVASEDNDKLHKLSFGNDITSAPTVTELTLTGDVLDQPFRIEIAYDALSYYGFLSGNSNLYRLNIGNDISTGSVSVTDLGDLGVLQSSLAGFDFVKHESDYRGFAISSNTEAVYKISFSDNCSASQLVSSEEQPSTISYSESGTYEIALKALDANGNVSYSTNTVTVNTNVAPDIDFIIDDNRCVSNSNSFTSINTSGDIQTYSWDFGDGSGTSSSADTTYLYDSVNTFTVTLDVVSTGGCFNSVSQEISIYPEPSTPDFDYTAASLCSNSEITFINKTDSTGLEGVISYLWDFDGEATSTQKDTVYVFSSTGTKTVGLQGMIPGCTTVVYSEDLVIEEGPTALFSYSNNCFGSAIEFTDESSGLGIVSYSWDFGDGLGTSSQSDTVYQYSGAGTYSVRLTVTNSSGCETTYTEDITVNDQPLTDFTSIGSTENVPVQFNGLDLTLSDDSITGWLWDFDGLGSSTDQNPSFTFTEALSYTVSLMVSTSQGCADSVGQIINITESVCPYSDFAISNPTVCTNEVLSLTNSSANGTTYEWDFCVGELSSIPTGEETITVSSSSTPTGISYIEDDSLWYGFVLSRGGNTIQRISYGSNLDSAVSTSNVTDLGNIGGLLSGPEGISFVQESGIWYGIVANYTTDQLVLLNFGASLSTDALDITGSEIPTPSGVNFNLPSDIEITKVGTDYVMFVGNRNGSNINRLIFSGSITNDPTGDDITVTGSSKPRSTSLLRDCDNWYLFVASEDNDKLHKLSFGNDITSAPTVTELTLTGDVLDQPFRIEIAYDALSYYGFLSGNSNLYRLNIGNDISTGSVSVTDLGDLGVLQSSLAGFDFVKHESDYRGFAISSNTEAVYKISFSDNCSASQLVSSEEQPSTISYSESGTYEIALKALDANGNVSYSTNTVTVNTNVAPDIDFIIDDNRCISNANSFTSINTSGDIQTYSWDFGDGSGASSEANPTYQYTNEGTYHVSLEVENTSGCSNQFSQEITIFPEPPSPTFEYSADIFCTNNSFQFTNTTNESAYDNALPIHLAICRRRNQ